MANVTVGGFRPWGTFSGGEGVLPQMMVRPVASGFGTQINKFDVIKTLTAGTVQNAGAGDSTGIVGVAMGFSYVSATPPTAGKRVPSDFLPASTTFTPSTVGSPNESLCAYVPFTSDLICIVNANGTTSNTVAGRVGLIGKNCNLIVNGTPSTVVGNSCQFLDDSTEGTSTAQFRIIGIPSYTLEGGLDITKAGAGDPTVAQFQYLVVLNQGFLPPYATSGI